MNCQQCSSEIPDTAKFCPECGAKIVRKAVCPECGTDEALRRTAEGMKECGVTREKVLQALCESGGMDGYAPYFDISPEELAECRRKRKQCRLEMAARFENLPKFLQSLPKEDVKETETGDA